MQNSDASEIMGKSATVTVVDIPDGYDTSGTHTVPSPDGDIANSPFLRKQPRGPNRHERRAHGAKNRLMHKRRDALRREWTRGRIGAGLTASKEEFEAWLWRKLGLPGPQGTAEVSTQVAQPSSEGTHEGP